jgi:hypothetical protein
MHAARIITSCPNLEGKLCGLCQQIAYRIAVFDIGGKDTEMPLCGLHYIEALSRAPAGNQA